MPRNPGERTAADERWNEKRSPAYVKVHTSIQGHRKTVGVFADNHLLAAWVRILVLARDRGIAETDDWLELSPADRERVSGRRRADVAATFLERLADSLRWNVERSGNVWRIKVRNFAKKQGITPRKPRTSTPNARGEYAQTPLSPSPSPSVPTVQPANGRPVATLSGSDPVKSLFDSGVDLLVRNGATERAARGIVGQLRKYQRDKGGDPEVAKLIVEAAKYTDPAAFLERTMRPARRGFVGQ